ncbi:EpsG family protein [Vibrio splendidus]|uniref:EpsG family protein n=1 Tax=Vibrio splendidus TaxID=29497 RepID=UPI0012FFE33F|nr:EpsG family protein [Vibrio splendidus]
MVLLLTLIFGLRVDVGADWFEYIRIYDIYKFDSFIFNHIEFGFKAINVIASTYEFGFSFVIITTTFLFFAFTIFGCRLCMVNPYLFLALIFPYYVVMSGMNYLRQSLGLSVFIVYVALLLRSCKISSILMLLLGMSFHKSILIFSVLSFLRLKIRYIVIFGLPFVLFGVGTQLQSYNDLYLNSSHYSSSGFLLRYMYVLISCCIYCYLMNSEKESEYRWRYVIVLGTVFVAIVAILSTTAADRLAYYFIVLNTLLILRVLSQINFNKNILIFVIFTLTITSQLGFFIWANWGSIASYYIFKHAFFSAMI